MKTLFAFFSLFLFISCNNESKDDYLKKIEDYQYEENLKFHDESKSPLTKEDLKTFKKLERSEEHTSELQSHHDLVCRLLLEKKKSAKQAQTMHNTANTTQSQQEY